MIPGRPLPPVLFLSVLLSACLLGWACSEGGIQEIPNVVTNPRPSSIIVFPADITFFSLGAAQQVTATVRDETGFTVSGVSVSWESSDNSVAQVTSSGVVTAVSPGECRVKAVHGTLSASVVVRVQ
jgi:hypothetical protein